MDIEIICPGHGPVLTENPREIVEICREWSTVVNPNKGKTVVIPYVSAYGYTEILAEKIAEGIKASGDVEVRLFDMVTAEMGKAMDEIAFADGILFGTPTILGEALKPIWDMTTSMFPGVHGGKFASAFGSYGWSGEGVPNIMARLKQLRMKVYGEGLKVRFKPNRAQLQEAFEFGYGFGLSVLAGEFVAPKKQAVSSWKCLVCGEITTGTEPPAACPVCGVGPEKFVEIYVEPVTFKSAASEKIIVIGNGAAGVTACEEIRARNAVCTIELIAKENVIGYNRPMLTKGILSEIDMLNLFIKPFSWYKDNNIKLTLDCEVKEIKPEIKTVVLKDGTSREYDKLILATGAECFVPPIKGADKAGVFSIRSLTNVNELRDYIARGAVKAAVIGGGVLGLEAAWELKKAGLQVSIIEAGSRIMGRQLDKKGAELLETAIKTAGMQVFIGTGIQEISGTEEAQGVKLADGTVVDAQVVIISTGVKQNIELAKAIGIEVGRSIIVNERMETGVEGIFACGDCAEFNGVNYAIWPQAVEMGKVAGANAAGDFTTYMPVTPAVNYSGMNTEIFSIGDNGGNQEKKYKTTEYCDEENLIYEKRYFLNGRFCGGILIGDTSKSQELLL
ncbi:MAG: FAD-dependent oxidoreductase, partial [Anaerovorax sp.]